MEIAIIANDTKKDLVTQFCIAYCGVLAKHNVCATKMTGRMIAGATGLDIEELLPGTQGGIQQITSRVIYNEIDIVIYLRDEFNPFALIEIYAFNAARDSALNGYIVFQRVKHQPLFRNKAYRRFRPVFFDAYEFVAVL